MSRTPLPPPNPLVILALRFLQRLGLVLGASLGVVVVAALALGQFNSFGLANLLFWASLVVFGIAVWPAVSELGSGVSMIGRAALSREKNLRTMLVESREQRDRWLDNSIVFGLAGIVIFVLSLLSASWFGGR